MRIKSLKISNILSIEDATITFDDSGLVLVEGWNFDDGRANGAGKTAIFNALCFALYDDLPRKITASEIVRKNAKQGFAEVVLTVGTDTFLVRRERPKNVHFEKNGAKVDQTQQEFESAIKLSYQQFLVSMYTAQSGSSKFIHLNDSGKKEFFLQLMALNDFNKCKKTVDEYIKTLEKTIEEETSNVTANKSKIEVYKETIRKVSDLTDQVALQRSLLNSLNDQIKNIKCVDKPDNSDIDLLEKNISEKLSIVLQAKAKRSVLYDQYNSLSRKDKPFSGSDKCVTCGTTLDMSHAAAQHEVARNSVKEEMLTIKLKLDKLDLLIAKERELNDQYQKLRNERSTRNSVHDGAIKELNRLSIELERKKIGLRNLEDQLSNAKSVEDKISALEIVVNRSSAIIEQKHAELVLNEALSSIYSSTGAPAYILDSMIDSFNESVSEYASMIWPNATYSLRSFKESKQGDITAKFSEELIINGKERSIGSLSGGELRSLSLAIDFAIVDVLNKNFGIDMNPIIMDEPFEGLDSAGRETVIELLEKLSSSRQILVVDHASEAKAMFSKVIRIEKRNGISAIV